MIIEINEAGHDQLLEICLLKKTGRHNFIIARQHSSNNYFSCQLVESSQSLGINWIQAVSLLVKKISTARIANGRQRFWKMSTARHNLY